MLDLIFFQLAGNAGGMVSSPGLGRFLEKEMATHSSILAWEIPWTKAPEGLQPMESQRVVHNLLTKQQQQYIDQWNTIQQFNQMN